ncbi:cytochrome P450 [Periconia macrospinosa]|uniref:Cytochrome P450 n=1 Tax=Periconia macrospinosa TaxID=97972 RepID=A0A2V1D3E8_9PLEO|nr:cytochrome P450 [Periconia macrospinosa]
MSELVVGGMRMVTMPYGPKWRRYRTFCHNLLTPKMTQSFVPTQTAEVGQMMYNLAFNTPNDMQSYKEHGLSDEDLAWLDAGRVEAGSQTSTVAMNNLMLYMAATPQVQERAHEELMRVIDADVTYKDMVIPKGTAIVCNTMALHFDPVRFPEPFSFNPERYLDYQKSALEYAAMPDPYHRDHFNFGAGRRMCPGARFAENYLALCLANMVWAFKIKPPVVVINGTRQDARLDVSEDAFEPYPLRSAKPFKCRFEPRDEERRDIIRRNWENIEKE